MSEDLRIFEFEQDFAGSLQCIPMVVRFKLDHCGIKLSLEQWCRFTHVDRQQLVQFPCSTPNTKAVYRRMLADMIYTRAGQEAKEVRIDPAPEWANAEAVPAQLQRYASQAGLTPPTVTQWAGLSPLQRFALLKLTRAGHDNANFTPAMREFGVLSS